jgi:signal transduction histidine kinase
MKFRTRLAWFGVAVASATLLIFGLLLTALVQRTGPVEQDGNLLDLAQRTVAALATAPADTFRGPILPPVPIDVAFSTEPYIAVAAIDGTVLFATGQVAGAPPSVPEAAISSAIADGSSLTTFSPVAGVELRIAVVPFTRPDIALEGVVVAGQSTSLTAENLRGLRAVLLVAGIVTALASWLVARLVAKRALAPLDRLASTASVIASTGELQQRLPEAGGDDEVGNLTSSFNRMLDRIEEQQRQLTESLENQRRFLADASHELRNPLASLRANLSFLDSHPEVSDTDRAAAITDSNRAAKRMTDLIDDLLRLARFDSAAPSSLETVEMRAVVEDAIGRTTGAPALVKVEDALVRGDPDDLARLVTNLLDNAFRHGAPPVEVVAVKHSGAVVLTVSDRGPGIASDQVDAIFERFYRLDPARSTSGGTGLGLAIARSLAERFGGSLVAANRPDGGAVFTLTLPSA